jgi:hypothetical protein
MGFINVTRDDFHLHLLGGTVASWRECQEEGENILVALGHDCMETGLTLRAASPSAWAD